VRFSGAHLSAIADENPKVDSSETRENKEFRELCGAQIFSQKRLRLVKSEQIDFEHPSYSGASLGCIAANQK
jgi:hypothetical protein